MGKPAEVREAGVGAEVEGPPDTLAEASLKDTPQQRIQRYEPLQRRCKAILAQVEGLDLPPRLRRRVPAVRDCGSYLLLRYYYVRGETRLAAANSCCEHLVCPFCALRRSARFVRSVHEAVTHLLQQDSGLRVFHLTFTVRHEPTLSASYRKLDGALKGATRRRRNARQGQKWSEFARMEGALVSIEVKRGEDGLWHPHAHVLALSRSYFDAAAIKAEWHALTGDSHVVNLKGWDQGDPIGACLEVSKYATKYGEDAPAKDVAEVWDYLKGKRLVRRLGCLLGVELPEAGPDELEPEDEPYVELVYRWMECGEYTLERTEYVNEGIGDAEE